MTQGNTLNKWNHALVLWHDLRHHRNAQSAYTFLTHLFLVDLQEIAGTELARPCRPCTDFLADDSGAQRNVRGKSLCFIFVLARRLLRPLWRLVLNKKHPATKLLVACVLLDLQILCEMRLSKKNCEPTRGKAVPSTGL